MRCGIRASLPVVALASLLPPTRQGYPIPPNGPASCILRQCKGGAAHSGAIKRRKRLPAANVGPLGSPPVHAGGPFFFEWLRRRLGRKKRLPNVKAPHPQGRPADGAGLVIKSRNWRLRESQYNEAST